MITTNRMIATSLLSFSMIFGMSSCALVKHNDKLPKVDKSVAMFDYFDYKGEDDYYISNSLTSDDYIFNPVLPGWYSDPSVCTNGKGDYFLVTSTFSYFPGVPIFHSKNLINWKQIGHILDRPSQLIKLKDNDISRGIFAPAISYNPHNKTYYMITTNVCAGNFFVKTKNPFGKWSEPIMLPTIQGIDPSFFFDEDGKAYIVNNDDAPDNKPEYSGHRTIRVQEFDVNTDKTVGPRFIIVNKGSRPEEKPIWIEGPHLYKINGRYFLMSAEGGTGANHSEVIFEGTSPMGKYTPWKNNPILTQRQLSPDRPNPITCAGHADLIQTKEGDWWAFFLACRPINNKFENLGRETFMMPVKWSSDGFPYMTQNNDIVPMMIKRDGVKRDKHVTSGNFEVVDNFDNKKLGTDWMTLRAPASDLYSLDKVPGYLSLKCSDITSTKMNTPAFVCRRMQHHKFECTTRMLFNFSDDKEKAGVLLFKDEKHQYFLAVGMKDNLNYITLYKIGENMNMPLATQKLGTGMKEINLKVISLGTSYEFYYSTEDDNWKSLCKNIDAEYLSTEKAGGFTGTTIGLYAVKE